VNVIIITPYADPERGACVVRANSFHEYFKAKGWNCLQLAPIRGRLKKNSIKVIRYNGVFDLMFKLLTLKADVVIGTSPPLPHNFFALLVCKLKRVPFILDSKDPFTYIIEKTMPDLTQTWKFKLFKFMESFTHRHSDAILALNEPNAKSISQQFGVPMKKIILAPNGADLKRIKPRKEAGLKIRKKLKIPLKVPVLVYSGCIGGKDLEGFFKYAAPRFVESTDGHIILMATMDDSEQARSNLRGLLSIVKDIGIDDHVHVVINVPFEKVSDYYSAANMALIPFEDYPIGKNLTIK